MCLGEHHAGIRPQRVAHLPDVGGVDHGDFHAQFHCQRTKTHKDTDNFFVTV